ncbi:protein S100-A1 isoform X1 [Salvelinus sp. IW2-2015]|uniref:protein S100-A1 isoform X1 n=2 Tax=Salvelinus sp. IW2-2015 TaxID=2691554 RepID=UPI000CDFE75C|nr:protein S100-A1 isoform X1 [Salvelinus alpinus]
MMDALVRSPSVTDTMAQPTPLETSLGALIMAFHKHTGSGAAKTLSKKELTNLIKEELPNITGKGGPDVGELMTMLDHDGDGAVDSKEYITLIESLACMCDCFLEGKMYLLSAFYSVLH